MYLKLIIAVSVGDCDEEIESGSLSVNELLMTFPLRLGQPDLCVSIHPEHF